MLSITSDSQRGHCTRAKEVMRLRGKTRCGCSPPEGDASPSIDPGLPRQRRGGAMPKALSLLRPSSEIQSVVQAGDKAITTCALASPCALSSARMSSRMVSVAGQANHRNFRVGQCIDCFKQPRIALLPVLIKGKVQGLIAHHEAPGWARATDCISASNKLKCSP